MSHGKVVCQECSSVIVQCRCMDTADHKTTYEVCAKCQATSSTRKELTFEQKLETNTWDNNLDEVVATVKELSGPDSNWTWTRNWDCKYIDIHIDMRDGWFTLIDNKGKRISLEQLKRQRE